MGPGVRKVSVRIGKLLGNGWASFALLWFLFDAPQGIQSGDFSLLWVQPSIDVPLLMAAYLLIITNPSLRSRLGAFASKAFPILAVVLFVYGLDRAIWGYLMRADPLLYDQVVMVRHTFVLVGDLFSFWLVAALIAGIVSVVGMVLLARRLLGNIHSYALGSGGLRFRNGVAFIALVATLLALLPGRALGKTHVLSAHFFQNVGSSVALAHRLRRDIGQSPYKGYANIELKERPRIELFFVESYGRLLHDDPALRKLWYEQLERLHQRMSAGGLEVVSSFSEAPVSGGRSWVSEGAVLMGAPVRYEVVFRDLVRRIERIPHLVGFLDQQGYHTVLLAPADRVRLGLENENRYSYDRTVTYDDLAYPGPEIGWGRIPDQYSLAWVERNVLGSTREPTFLNFHMVSSHAPWESIPTWDENLDVAPTSSGDGGPTRGQVRVVASDPSDAAERKDEVRKRLLRLRRDRDQVFGYYEASDGLSRGSYARAIFYELEVLGEYLARDVGPRLVIIVGDHQPPAIASASASFQVPIHVAASDRRLLEEFELQGFQEGIVPSAKHAVRHEALFSLIVRALARSGAAGGQLPPYLPQGAPLGG